MSSFFGLITFAEDYSVIFFCQKFWCYPHERILRCRRAPFFDRRIKFEPKCTNKHPPIKIIWFQWFSFRGTGDVIYEKYCHIFIFLIYFYWRKKHLVQVLTKINIPLNGVIWWTKHTNYSTQRILKIALKWLKLITELIFLSIYFLRFFGLCSIKFIDWEWCQITHVSIYEEISKFFEYLE